MGKIALITGITGQDGYYMAEKLLNEGYYVFGTCKNTNNLAYDSFISKFPNIGVFECDVSKFNEIFALIDDICPNEIYNFAAQSVSVTSYNLQRETFKINAGGVLNILESIRKINENIKFLQASSSEIFGKYSNICPQNELTIRNPKTPYAAAKLYADNLIKIYREQLNLWACSAILYNHESPRRGNAYVTKKISQTVANIKKGKSKKLYIGNLNAKRDWGHAKDYVECMWRMLQISDPDDFIISTGELHTVREFCEFAFDVINIDLVWENEGIYEKGYDAETGEVFVEVDPKFFRTLDDGILLGDNKKSKINLDWEPSISFKDIVVEMVNYELNKCE